MKCMRCGSEIDTKNRRADGCVVCPGCGTVYRPKIAAKQVSGTTSTQRHSEIQKKTIINGPDPKRPKMLRTGWALVLFLMVLCCAAGLHLYFTKTKDASDTGVVELVSDEGKRIIFYQSSAEHIVKDDVTGKRFVDNELILTFDADISLEVVKTAVDPYGGSIVGVNDYLHSYQVLFDREYSHEELKIMSQEIQDQFPSATAMSNYYIEIELTGYTPDDTEWKNQWDKTPDGKNWGVEAIRAPEMWEYAMSRKETPVNVGVLDDQFYTDHEDLTFQKVFLNDFDAACERPCHGTHVSGTIAATFDNGKGIAGIARNVNLYGASMNGLGKNIHEDSYGIPVDEYEAGLSYLIAIKNCKAINLSYGGGLSDPPSEEDHRIAEHIENTLQVLINEGYDFLIAKAAGNGKPKGEGYVRYLYSDYDLFSLFRNQSVLDRIITVGAAELGDCGDGEPYHIWAGSNYGNKEFEIDLIAPGVKILSTTCKIIKAGPLAFVWAFPSIYENKTGTSMAAPHVTGTAAAIWSLYPSLSGPEMKQIVCSTAHGRYGYEGYREKTAVYYPMLDAYAAVLEAERYTKGKGSETTPDKPAATAEPITPTPQATVEPQNQSLNEKIITMASRCADDFISRDVALPLGASNSESKEVRQILDGFRNDCQTFSYAGIFTSRESKNTDYSPPYDDYEYEPMTIANIAEWYFYLKYAPSGFDDHYSTMRDFLSPNITGSVSFPCPSGWTENVNVVLGNPNSKTLMWIIMTENDSKIRADYAVIEMGLSIDEDYKENIMQYWAIVKPYYWVYPTELTFRSPYGTWDRIEKYTNIVCPEKYVTVRTTAPWE